MDFVPRYARQAAYIAERAEKINPNEEDFDDEVERGRQAAVLHHARTALNKLVPSELKL